MPAVVELDGPRITHSRRVTTCVVGAIAALAIAQFAYARSKSDDGLAIAVEPICAETPSVRVALTTGESEPPPAPVESRLEQLHPIPHDADGTRIDETYPTLDAWIHPIVGAAERFPRNPGRHFGAVRRGIERPDCGAGHCGVDLDGPRGRALVAVAEGIVVKVELREDGGDGISGRYVRIQHADGTLTTYMHMEEVDPGLQVRDRVVQGQLIGRLGSSGVVPPVAHLHFSLEFPKRAQDRGDLSQKITRFIDPAPFLLRATVTDAPVRRHSIKPAS